MLQGTFFQLKQKPSCMARLPQRHHKGFMVLTWAYPRGHVNLHAKEQLPFGGVQCFLLILLLPEEHQPIALFRGPVNLHRRHLPVLLELMEQPIFKAGV